MGVRPWSSHQDTDIVVEEALRSVKGMGSSNASVPGVTAVDLLAAAAGRVRSTVAAFRAAPSAGAQV